MRKSIIKHTLVAAFWLLIWQMSSKIVGSDFLLPTVFDAFHALLALLCTNDFYLNVGATFYRCVVGILLSFTLGAGTAFISYRNKYFKAILSLPVSFLKAVPVVAIIIYGILLMNAANVPILACFLMCYPVSYTNILSGLYHMDSQLLEMAQVYKLSDFTKIRYIYLPSLVPHIKSALSLTAGLSWKSVIAAEVLSVPIYSMGYELLESKIYFETNFLFAWVITIVALSLVFEKFIKFIVSKIDIKSYSGSKINLKYVGFEASSPILPFNIRLSEITKSFDTQSVLKGFTANFQGGQVTALMGPSGKGKTTILRIMASLDRDYKGHVEFLPKDSFPSNEPSAEMPNISYLFQENRLLPWLNVYDNIAIVLKGNPQFCSSVNANNSINRILEILELSESMYKLPSELSGGMQQRIALARALIYPSSVLLLDEPFTGLDNGLKSRITDNIRPYLIGKTTILVTHSNDDVKRLAGDRILQV